MASRSFIFNRPEKREASTSDHPSIALTTRAALYLVRFHALILSPFIVLTSPKEAFFGQQITIMIAATLTGFLTVLLGRQRVANLVSIGLLASLVWGKVASNIFQTRTPDAAYLLFQFVLVLFFIEASSSVARFERQYNPFKGREDEHSRFLGQLFLRWVRRQLWGQAKLVLAGFTLSLALSALGTLTSLSLNQFVVIGVFPLLIVVVLLFLVSYRRETGET